jgi:hypothetical protein
MRVNEWCDVNPHGEETRHVVSNHEAGIAHKELWMASFLASG